MVDRHQRSVHLQEVLRVWLATREDVAIGAYWPIKGEFDALPALYRWTEADEERCIGLPVIDKALVDDGPVYEGRIRAVLGMNTAPDVFGWLLFWTDDWSATSEWYAWTLRR